jgi:ribosomal protein S3AE
MADKKKVSRIKTKKKIWHKVLAPAIFGKKEIGESYLTSAEQAKGRPLKINLKDLTGSVRDQNAYISFKIVKWQGTTLETTVTGYELTTAYVKRLVRKNCNKLDDYFTFKTKDGKEIVLKSLLLTIHKVPRSTRSNLRSKLKELLNEEISKVTFDTLISNIVGYKIQGPAKKKLAKIYPLKEVAIRKIFILNESKVTKEPVKIVETAKVEKKVSEQTKGISNDSNQVQEKKVVESPKASA